MKKINTQGSSSYFLTKRGAVYVRKSGLYPFAKSGKDLTCNGPLFFHDTIGTIGFFLLMRILKPTSDVFISEYEICRKIDPSENQNFDIFKKNIPFTSDGLIQVEENCFFWIETENASKSHKKVKEKLNWLIEGLNSQMGEISTVQGYSFGELMGTIFIVPHGNQWPSHEKYIRSIIEKYTMRYHHREREDYWYFLRLYLSDKLHLKGYSLIKITKKLVVHANGEREVIITEEVSRSNL